MLCAGAQQHGAAPRGDLIPPAPPSAYHRPCESSARPKGTRQGAAYPPAAHQSDWDLLHHLPCPCLYSARERARAAWREQAERECSAVR
jgi:hypothetical protein